MNQATAPVGRRPEDGGAIPAESLPRPGNAFTVRPAATPTAAASATAAPTGADAYEHGDVRCEASLSEPRPGRVAGRRPCRSCNASVPWTSEHPLAECPRCGTRYAVRNLFETFWLCQLPDVEDGIGLFDDVADRDLELDIPSGCVAWRVGNCRILAATARGVALAYGSRPLWLPRAEIRLAVTDAGLRSGSELAPGAIVRTLVLPAWLVRERRLRVG